MGNVAFETIQREASAAINSNPGEREILENKYGRVWNTSELQQDFEVQSFAAPFIMVKSRKTGNSGSMTFQARPRYYFDFQEVI
jgi:hypothetical protein